MRFHLWDMFTKIKNGQLVKKTSILQQKQNLCARFLNLLWDEGFILGYKTSEINPNMFEIFLKYNHNKPCIQLVKFISKPSKRVHFSVKQLWKIDTNSGLIILSTNRGVLSIQQCRKLKIGGEPFVLVC